MPTETVAAIQASAQSAPIVGDQVVTAAFSALAAGGAAVMWIRRKLSKDSLEIKKDSAEGDLIQHLEDERDHLEQEKDKILERLIIVDKERQEAVALVGKLSADVEHLTRQVSHLERLVENLGSKLDLATTKMQEYAIENARLSAIMSSKIDEK